MDKGCGRLADWGEGADQGAGPTEGRGRGRLAG